MRFGVGVPTIVTLLVTLTLAPGAFAQTPADRFEGLSRVLRADDLVTVVGTDGVRTSGRVVDLSNASLAITAGPRQQQRMFPALDVGRIVRKDPVRDGVVIGAITGGAAGLVGGLLLNAICVNEVGGCPGAVVGLTALGLAGGAAAGWGLDSALGNRVVFDNRVINLPKEHMLEFFGSIGSGRAGAFGSSLFNVAGGVGRRSVSGIGVEGEVSRTLGGGAIERKCIPTYTASGPGPCIGMGEFGIGSMSMATGRFVYTFPKGRVQPFVSVGASLQKTNRYSAYAECCLSNPQISQYHYYTTSIALPVGGGVRFPVTRSIALRPEFAYYAGDDAFFRASVGIVYQRKCSGRIMLDRFSAVRQQ